MKTIKKEKTFDAVKMMREIRDKISRETQNMTFEQLKEYINTKLADSNVNLVGQHHNPNPNFGKGIRTADFKK